MKNPRFLSSVALLPVFAIALASELRAQTPPRVPLPLAPSVDVKSPAEPSLPPTPELPRGSPSLPSVANGTASTPPTPAFGHIDHSRMYYFDAQDGTIWARGANFKASFGARGATLLPCFGRKQPHAMAHVLSPDAVTIGGAPIAFEHTAQCNRDGDRIALDRGSFIESYDLTVQSMEQRFTFNSLEHAGELALHISVASELEARESADGIEFRGELGRVVYGRATAIDARGRTIATPTTLEGGAIVIRVPAEFVATAAMPLVIDPVVTTFTVDSTLHVDYEPNAAYNAGTHTWCVVYEEYFASGDSDVFVSFFPNAGAPVTGYYLDLSADDWTHTRVANLAAYQQFMVVSGVESVTQQFTIQGRTISGTGAPQAQFLVAGGSGQTGVVSSPDIGGDPYPIAPSYYCVVYQRQYSVGDRDILARTFSSDGTGGAPIFLANSFADDLSPCISKSDGGSEWLVAWERVNPTGVGNIWAGRISWSGSVTANPFQVSSSTVLDHLPSASSPISGTHKNVIVWENVFLSQKTIQAALVDGSSVVSTLNLSASENLNLNDYYRSPSVDCDGQHFIVAYDDYVGLNTIQAYFSELFVAGTNLELAQVHLPVCTAIGDNSLPCVVAMAGSGETDPALKHRFLCAWQRQFPNTTDTDIEAGFIDASDSNQATSFCFGDGSGAACPCNNNGAPGRGCDNSSSTGGALLIASGVASIASDTLLFTTQNEKPSALSVLFQGTTQTASIPWGQGLRCVGGLTKRLYTKTASNGSITAPAAGDPSVHVRSAAMNDPIAPGSMRYYYGYYRDANVVGGCSPLATANDSQAIAVTWAQ